MSNITALKDVTYDGKALALIRRTVASDCTDDEFEMFVAQARALKLNPLRRQVYAFVYNKNDPQRRRLSIVTGIDGFRTVAARTGNYRPDDDEPRFEYDEAQKGPANPLGLAKATVSAYQHSHGSWHRITATAYWSEYVPDRGGGKWQSMPRLMLSKCAEALALRKGWPDEFSNVYSEEETDAERMLDLTATEIIAETQKEDRQAKLGGPTILIDWCDGNPLEGVAIGQFADRCIAFIEAMEPSLVQAWADRNRYGLREFWAHNAGDALALKTAIEKAVG